MDPIKTTLSKQRIGAILRRIEAGDSVEPEGPAWTLIDCLTVAGVLLSSASTSAQARRGSGSRAGAAGILKNLQATMEFVGAMANAYSNDTWDEFFEPSVTIGIGAGGVKPLEGFKK